MRALVSLEVLARRALRGGVLALNVLVGAPGVRAPTSIVEAKQLFAGEAVVANIADLRSVRALSLGCRGRAGSM